MKTATIQIYPLFQASGYGTRMLYKGQCLRTATMVDKREAIAFMRNAAKIDGFTHAKFCEENHWGKVTIYSVKLKD